MTSTPALAPRSPRWLFRAGLLFSLAYCLSAGVLALWSPAQNGIDLSVCYVAGVAALRGSSPYSYDELTDTRQTLNAALADKPSYPFAYPPPAIPACVLLSRLPWESAQALWKLLNLGFLVGSVSLAFWLFAHLDFTLDARYLVWCFVFIFSPTVSVLLVGQSSLFVLFAALSTVALYHLQRPWPAGLTLTLALTKPHLTFPLVLLLLFRRQYKIVITGIAVFALAVLLGLHLGHSDIQTYVDGLRSYASRNSAANPRLVGIQNVVTGVLGLSPAVGGMLGLIGGLLLLGMVLLLDRKESLRNRSEEVLPLLLLVSVLSFGAHSYDLVFLIPLCMWAIGKAREDRRFLPIVILCFLLILPLGLVTITYRRLLSHFLPLPVFRVVIEPFRSWILVILSIVVTYLTWAGVAGRKRSESARGDAVAYGDRSA